MTRNHEIDVFPAAGSGLATIRKEKVQLSKGLSLNVTEWLREAASDHDRPTLLLLHGLGDAAGVWRDVAIPLTARFRVLSVDLRGHGDSSWALDGNYATDAMADDIAALLGLLKLGSVTLAGHSLGAAVALRVASIRACEALVLADFGLEANPASVAHLLQALRDAHRSYPSVEAYAGILAERHPVAPAGLLDWIAADATYAPRPGDIRLKYDPAILAWRERRNAFEADLDTARSWNLLTKLRCRALVLRGVASSVLSAKVAEKMVNWIGQHGILAEIPVAGHSIHIDNPQAVKDAMQSFLAEKTSRGRTCLPRTTTSQRSL